MDPSSYLWFHGLITRDKAEKCLKECSSADGNFLVRESTGKVGCYVLSMTHRSKVIHYQLNKKDDGLIAIEGGPSFKGPVELVNYHKEHQDRLLTKLLTPCNRHGTADIEVYHKVTHADLEEATQAALLTNHIDDAAAVKYYKGQFQKVIGDILHKEQPWFHGIIPRIEAESRMKTQGMKDGMFLFRERGIPRGTFALVLAFQNKLYHYLFEPNPQNQISIKAGRLFDNLMGVVTFYSQNCEGLWCVLTEPCDVRHFEYKPKKEMNNNILLNAYIQDALNKKLLSAPEELKKFNVARRRVSAGTAVMNRRSTNDSQVPPKRGLPAGPAVNSDAWKTEKIYDTAKLAVTEGYAKQTKDRVTLQLDPGRLKLEEELGHGNFGSVMKGLYKSENGQRIQVAVKTLKEEDMANQKSEVLAEADIMAKLDHPHIVRLIGVTQSPHLMIVMEIAPLGPLNKYLKKHAEMKVISILLLMLQVNEGMDYLELQGFVHRDLAARNVLVVSPDFVKISDFGMSRATGAGNEYYRAERAGKWPLKWYAPECIYYRKFSSKGDVWSYAVTMWEALTYGSKPYPGLKGPQIVEGLEQGKRLQQPNGCPDAIYSLMWSCWEINPDNRPTFNEIGVKLHHFLQISSKEPSQEGEDYDYGYDDDYPV